MHKYTLFLRDVEQKQIYQASWKREGRRRVIRHPELPRLSRLLTAPLPAPGFLRMRQVAVPERSTLGGAFPPNQPRPIRTLGEGCSGQGCGVAKRQQRPRVPSPPDPPSVSSPRDRTVLLPALPAPLNSRGVRRARSPAAWGQAARLCPRSVCHSPAPGRAKSNSQLQS